MKNHLLSFIATSMLSLAIFSTAHADRTEPNDAPAKPIGIPSNFPGVVSIKATEVVMLADMDEEIVIFDTRSATARKQGKISWSESFEKNQMTTQHLSNMLASKDTVVVFYGNKNSSLAAKGAKFAAANGYISVYWLTGGWSEWTKSGLRLDM